MFERTHADVNDCNCPECGAKDSMQSESQEDIRIETKKGTYKELTFDFCEECGYTTNVDLS